ncbi:hypothetical protein PGT21_000994 [Puccinia graminis f. sp. tritici]|uniref:Chromo domain-containing protein n=1 Tax=Puccinia graminis f. sp. tritici TaxID=56615 RepID=A0A5B0PCV7_PUCGR|nr:hypothetical protein PGT21_000994 [Puccinia graminis f. sp. tritici]
MKKPKRQPKEWPASQILQESGGKYLIEWIGLDPSTGSPWEPTWEPKKMANHALVADWQKTKKSGGPERSESASDIHLPGTTYNSGQAKAISKSGGNTLTDCHINPHLTKIKSSPSHYNRPNCLPANDIQDLNQEQHNITTHQELDENPNHIVEAVLDPELRGHQTATFYIGDNTVEITGLGFILDPHLADPSCRCNQERFILGGAAARAAWPEHLLRSLQSQGITFV